MDANYFQHLPYLDDFNAEKGTHIVSVAGIHVEPMGIYGGKQTTLDAVPPPSNRTSLEGISDPLHSRGSCRAKGTAQLTGRSVVIEIKHLSKTFQMKDGAVNALKDINLTIPDGSIYGIIGMSGAGKSTLVRCINLLERPTEGSVVIDGVEMENLTPAQLRSAAGRSP